MPNHITNELKVSSDNYNDLVDFYKQYTTTHPPKVGRTYDGELRYREIGEDLNYGFLDESNGSFKTRNGGEWELRQGVPEGYEVDIDREYNQFPDFNKIIPMPDHSDTFYAEGGLSDKERREFGENNWYDWSSKHWGTKWNSYSHKTIQDIRWNETIRRFTAVFQFETAWSPVPKLISIMSEENPNVTIEYTFADEDFGYNYNTGMLVFEDGVIDETYPEGGSYESQCIYLTLNPEFLSEVELVNGKYEC